MWGMMDIGDDEQLPGGLCFLALSKHKGINTGRQHVVQKAGLQI